MAYEREPSGLDRCFRYAARGLSLLWALAWTLFVWATVASETISPTSLAAAVCLSLVFLGSAIVAWRWERIGSLLLFAEGLVILVGYSHIAHGIPLSTLILVILTLALPPMLAGTFLSLCRRGS